MEGTKLMEATSNESLKLPRKLRGRSIHTNIIPTVCKELVDFYNLNQLGF